MLKLDLEEIMDRAVGSPCCRSALAPVTASTPANLGPEIERDPAAALAVVPFNKMQAWGN